MNSIKILSVGATALVVALSQAAWADTTIAIKNFRQIIESLVVETGVPATDVDVKKYYALAASRLPREGSIDEINAPMLLTFTALSGIFCSKMVVADALKSDPATRRAHRLVNFTAGPDALTPEIRKSLVTEYSTIFWSRSATSQEFDRINQAIDEALVGRPITPAETKSVLTTTCSAVASSIDALLI